MDTRPELKPRRGAGLRWPGPVSGLVCLALACGGLIRCGERQGEAPCALAERPCQASDAPGPVAAFDPLAEGANELASFPTDLLTVADPATETGRRLNLQRFVYRDDLNPLDGFGTVAPLVVSFDDPLDESLLEAIAAQSTEPGAPVFLMRADGLQDPDADGLDLTERLVPLYLS